MNGSDTLAAMSLEQTLADFGLPPSFIVFLIATLPIIELRGAIPIGINYFNLEWFPTLAIAVAGNMLPVPVILGLLRRVEIILSQYPIFKRFFAWLFWRTRSRSTTIQKYGMLGLVIFIAIPLPVTGAWTGSVAAVLMGFPFRQALLHIFYGVLAAGLIVTMLSLIGWLGAIVAGASVLTLLLVTSSRSTLKP